MYPTGDDEFKDYTIEGVEGDRERGWWMTFDGSTVFGCPKDSPVVPVVGMAMRQYGRGFGFTVRGLFLDGQRVFYRTTAEDEAKCKADGLAADQKRRDDFALDKPAMDARYGALPACFRQRIDKFRGNNPEFRWQFEGYELFCCEQAVLIADTLKTPKAIGLWSAASWDEQKRDVPGLSGDHSGNTFGCAVQLAHWYLKNPENVVKMHGALAPLVGSKEYGCVPRDAVPA